MANEKNICNNLMNKIFGSNFYFVHGTFGSEKFKDILKCGKISIASEIPKEKWRWEHDDNSSKYVFCVGIYDDYITNAKKCYIGSSYLFLIDPRILFHEDIIFNSQ